MTDALFRSIDSATISSDIRDAEYSVCYAAPGIQIEPAKAIVDVAGRIGPELVTVCLDFDERVFRMGFGDIDAVNLLRNAGVIVNSSPGLRTGLLIIDRRGFIFTPIALYLEADERSGNAPNAMCLSTEQILEAQARLSPAAKQIAIFFAKTDEDKKHLRDCAVELPSAPIKDNEYDMVAKQLVAAPPARFDVARQVRVFSAYLQYVEINLLGAAIQRYRLSIPASIQNLGGTADLEGRLRTTFELIEKEGDLSSKNIEKELNDIRKNFTRSIGRDRVVLTAAKKHFEVALNDFREKLSEHRGRVEIKLQEQLNASREKVVEHYLPTVLKNPPDQMLGELISLTEEDVRAWLAVELDKVFPRAEKMLNGMTLEVRFKDVTFETLNHKDFLRTVQVVFPHIKWDNLYNEFRAIGERRVAKDS